ncbi:uncharacterized protein LOC132182989 [Corylus avellana]|uniref:uncharacterized protein LOC132182989 n=1 Tax=Corylus avellana TaxID=13451 RepID=UPI00286B143D|nr:uncharacterized protein LOC132182989 [Corylus avellana]
MPSRAVTKRRRALKSVKKMKNPTNPTYHSLPNFQPQGVQGSKKEVYISDQHALVGEEEVKEGYTFCAVSVISASDHEMEEPSNGKIEDTQRVDLQEDYREVQSVVESSDGNLEGTQKVELEGDEYKEEVVTQDVGEEVEAVVESVSEIVVDGNFESVDEVYSGLKSNGFDKEEVADEKSSEVVDSGKVEEEKEVTAPLYHFNQGLEELVENSIGLELKEKEEKTPLSSSKTNGISSVVANEELKGIEETNFLSSDEINGSPEVLENTVSKGIEETTLPTVDENSEVPVVVTDVVSRGIEETKWPASDASVGEPSGGVDGASKENVSDSLQTLDDAPAVDTSNAGEEGNKTEIPESTGNPHIISVSRRSMQPTSWRSCCGLFEVLRRSDR